MVIAPMRKNRVSAVSPRCIFRISPTCAATDRTPSAAPPMAAERYCPGSVMYAVQHNTHMRSATAALFTLVKLSAAMHTYPATKINTIVNVKVVIVCKK